MEKKIFEKENAMTKEKALAVIAASTSGFMATVEGNQPRVRPMVIKTIWEKKVYLATFRDSRKVQQIAQQPNVELLWVDMAMRQVRMAGVIRECDNPTLRKKYLEENPIIQRYYKGVDDPRYLLLEVTPVYVEYKEIEEYQYHTIVW